MSPREWPSCARAGNTPTLQRWVETALWALLVVASLLVAGQAAAQVRYYYDELGRLIEVVAPDDLAGQANGSSPKKGEGQQ